jgi:hypothetical protein
MQRRTRRITVMPGTVSTAENTGISAFPQDRRKPETLWKNSKKCRCFFHRRML